MFKNTNRLIKKSILATAGIVTFAGSTQAHQSGIHHSHPHVLELGLIALAVTLLGGAAYAYFKRRNN